MSPATRGSRLLPQGSSWIHASLDLPPRPRAALVIAPPFFHEAPRSQRLFSLLADELARLEVSVLRFDYRGSGDSGGEDTDFLPSRAIEDCRCALEALRGETGLLPVLLGVRAGALLGSALARSSLSDLWAWQPAADGRQLLAELDARERFELGYRLRFPFLARTPAPDPQVLMGRRLHAEFRLELTALPPVESAGLLLAPEPGEHGVRLPESLSAWAGQLDFSGRFPLLEVRALARELQPRLEATCANA